MPPHDDKPATIGPVWARKLLAVCLPAPKDSSMPDCVYASETDLRAAHFDPLKIESLLPEGIYHSRFGLMHGEDESSLVYMHVFHRSELQKLADEIPLEIVNSPTVLRMTAKLKNWGRPTP